MSCLIHEENNLSWHFRSIFQCEENDLIKIAQKLMHNNYVIDKMSFDLGKEVGLAKLMVELVIYGH